MPVFEYIALNNKGKKLKGIVDAESENQAINKLRGDGFFPVSLSATDAAAVKHRDINRSFSFKRIKSEEVSVMTRQLATLIGAGIPLVQALDSLVEQTGNALMQKVIAQIKGAVNEGKTFTKALEEHPRLFSSIYINMVRAGELSGSLDIVLERLADFSENQEALKGKLRAALVYPAFMAVIGSGILFVLITYIVPNITQVFEEMDKVLPLPTLFLIGLSQFLKDFWWVIIIGILLFGAFLRLLLRKPKGRAVWDLLKLKFFIIGPVSRKIILSRFSSTLGSLLRSGVGLLDSITIVRALVNNVHVAAVIDEAIDQIRKGKSMTRAFSNSEWFPAMFVQMIAVGEQSGDLETMLEKVSKAYEREVETAITGMTSLIEPVMIAFMGMAVGFIVISILLPIFEMNQMIG
jgi:general secretion pathway protein F